MTMFPGVYQKLECTKYFLNHLKALVKNAGGFTYIQEREEMRASLDGFFFEIISAKDFFLQGINDHYNLELKKQEATKMGKLKRCLENKGEITASKTISQIENLLGDKQTWLWQLNNYRNSATHRELIHFGHVATVPPANVPKVDITHEDIKTYLFKDPEDPQQGNADMEVIPYCEQSLDKMRKFLDSLYSELGN